jgi:hypothetical protein
VVFPEWQDLNDVVRDLAARVEALEAVQRPRVFTAEEVAPVVVPTAPALSSLLVMRVLSAMAHAPDGFGYEQEARAAIREVAAWLRDKGTPAQGWAMLLEQEANPTSQEDYDRG